MSLDVMIIVGIALLFAGWKLLQILRGKNDCGCGSSNSCSGSSCGGCSSHNSKENEEK